jgi:hypothetical protein
MKKRYWIYLALLIFGAFGSVLDIALFYKNDRYTIINDIVQLIGNVMLCVWLQREDAKEKGFTVEIWIRTLTIFFIPLGGLVYLFKTRHWFRAILIACGFIGGYGAAAATGSAIGLYLFQQ